MTQTAEFKPTHMLADIPVVRVLTGKWPLWEDENGVRHHVKGRRVMVIGEDGSLTPLHPKDKGEAPPEKSLFVSPKDREPSAAEELFKPGSQAVPDEVQPGDIDLLPVEVAAAVLRSACWPVYGEAYGYAETPGGDSATLDGLTPEGDARVKVCLRDGNWRIVRVPRQIAFEIAK